MNKDERLAKMAERFRLAHETFNTMDVKDQESLGSGKIEGTHTLAAWQGKFEGFRSFEENIKGIESIKENDSLPSGCILLIFAGIVTVIFSIGYSSMKSPGETVAIVGLIGIAGATLLFSYSAYFRGYLGKRKTSKFLLKSHKQFSPKRKIPAKIADGFVQPLLTCFGQDMEPKTLLNLKFNFGSKTSSEFKVPSPEKNPLNWSCYKIPWMQANTSLADATRIQMSIDHYVQYRHIKKTSRSGKTKYKDKYKIRIVYMLVMQFPAKKYKRNSEAKTLPGMRMKEGEKKIIVKVKAATKNKSPEAMPDYKKILELAQQAYAQLVFAHK